MYDSRHVGFNGVNAAVWYLLLLSYVRMAGQAAPAGSTPTLNDVPWLRNAVTACLDMLGGGACVLSTGNQCSWALFCIVAMDGATQDQILCHVTRRMVISRSYILIYYNAVDRAEYSVPDM